MQEQTYNEFIQNILETRGRFGIPKGEYKERHHIIPKCIGGTDNKENLIDLYAREHFEAHRLLALENPCNSKLSFSLWCMAKIRNNFHEKVELSSDEYEEVRKAYAISLSQTRKGKNNPMFGKNSWDLMNEDDKNIRRCKLSNSLKGKVCSAEARSKISKTLTGKPHPHTQTQNENIKKAKENIFTENMKSSVIALKEKYTNSHWYNNGTVSKRYKDCDVPDGWIKGNLYSKRLGRKVKKVIGINIFNDNDVITFKSINKTVEYLLTLNKYNFILNKRKKLLNAIDNHTEFCGYLWKFED